MAKILGHDIVMTAELEAIQQANRETVTAVALTLEAQQKLIDQYRNLAEQLRRQLYISLIVLAGTNLVTLVLAVSK